MASCVLLLVFFHNTIISILDKLWKLNTVCIENLVSLNSPELFMSMSFSFYFLAHFSMAAKEIVDLTAVNSDRQ